MGALDDFIKEKAGAPEAPVSPVLEQPRSGLDTFIADRSTPEAETQKPSVTGDTPWSEVLTSGAKNFVPDIGQTAVDIGQGLAGIGKAALHPQQTYESLKNADWGAMGDQLQHDYLTEEGWKQGIANRPFSRMLDVGAVASGPAALAGKAGLTGVAKTAAALDPATWLTKGAGAAYVGAEKLGNKVLGHYGTGTGGESLNLLFDAGRESKQAAKAAYDALNQKADPIAVVADYERALKGIEKQEYAAYKADKNAMRTDQQRLSYRPIMDALNDVDRRFADPFFTGTQPATAARSKIRELVEKEMRAAYDYDVQQLIAQAMVNKKVGPKIGPNPHLDPLGMDALKKAVGDIRDASTGEDFAAATAVYNAISNQIKRRAPIYDDMMGRYSNMRREVDSFRRELSLGSANKDTALRKLLSSLRHNVTANYGRRADLVNKLTDRPEARHGLYKIAGQTNAAWTPRGITGAFASKYGIPVGGGAAAYAGLINPFWIPAAMAASSPRLAGNAALAAGRVARNAKKVPWRPTIYAGQMGDHLSPFLGGEEEEQ